MGEYAEYILNGDDCQYCGEYLGEGDGFPRACASCAKDEKPTPVKLVSSGQIMGKKLRKALTYPKSRCVLTDKGEAALADIKAGKPVYIPN